MRDAVLPSTAHGRRDLAACAARAGEPVADDPRDFDPQRGVVLAQADRDDAQMMAHEPETTPTTVAALYVDPKGVYANLPGVAVWDEARDARLYAGPWPVVAHPPCARWCMLAPLNQSMHGQMIGDDGGCFAAALAAVERFGGVLEHPAYSYAWREFELPRPTRGMWVRSLLRPGWVTELSQSAYGHPARKRTWLYYVGPDPEPVRWNEPATSVSVSDFGPGNTRRRGEDWQPGIQYAAASATPATFRDALLKMASRP